MVPIMLHDGDIVTKKETCNLNEVLKLWKASRMIRQLNIFDSPEKPVLNAWSSRNFQEYVKLKKCQKLTSSGL